ncbi:7-methyl-GTP pyrophosphatase-like isoform X3 [Rhodamnia argentea]|uniref:7-methyl-GTP pyrophosphatase-like isoform X3 n=1 Tax=Rhodamnia argentea TaxID=178133 RepID=A0A8B8NP11_9MYRT|nr:7-methyl-GTP pyrophosphatase-like isoform X3 [Rhodamnia argentea]
MVVVLVVVFVGEQVILGSSSMARRHILAEMGYDFTVLTADIDEKAIRKEKPEELVMALAEAKADAILSRHQNVGTSVEAVHTTLLITADTVVVHEGRIREKPSSKDEARNFIEGYSGGRAEVVGSVLVTNLKTGRRKAGWDRAEVLHACQYLLKFNYLLFSTIYGLMTFRSSYQLDQKPFQILSSLIYHVHVAMGALETSKPRCLSCPPRLTHLIMSAGLIANCLRAADNHNSPAILSFP